MHTELLRVFYKVAIWMTEYELTIAQSTGRNRQHIRELRNTLDGYERDYHLFLINNGVSQ
jgi:hypothetical protein